MKEMLWAVMLDTTEIYLKSSIVHIQIDTQQKKMVHIFRNLVLNKGLTVNIHIVYEET